MNRLQDLGMSLALRLGRFTSDRRDIRAEGSRLRPVLVVWGMGRDPETQEVTEFLARLRQHSDVVLVTESLVFQSVSALGCFIEALPTHDHLAKQPMLDWQTYATRRIARIKRTWNPDFELTLGDTPEAYLARFSDDQVRDAPKALIEDYERIETTG